MISWLEWSGSILGILGATLVASGTKHSHWGWWLFFFSSMQLCVFALSIEAYGLLALHGCFVLTNILGLIRVWYPTVRRKRYWDFLQINGRNQ